jgi:multiple sugar transport system ATP-binding protein
MTRVKLHQITRTFNQVKAITDINFEIPSGEFWVLVGPSGCGKSTILRIIAGLESITEGSLYFDNTVINQIPARDRDVAMVFQNYALYPHMSVEENLAFGLKMRGTKRLVIEEKVKSVAQMLELSHLLTRKPKELSGGQQQRVALGRAIIRQPKVFLLDEPLSNLDAKLREQTRTELKKIHDRIGITTIYVTHDQIEAMTLGDRIVILDQGKIQQIGTPTEVYNNPANRMVATFLGTPPMNIIPVSYHDGKLWINEEQYLGISPEFTEKISSQNGQGWDLGIRPEHIQLVHGDNEHQNGDSYNTIRGIVDIIEPLGKEILVSSIISDSDLSLNLLLPPQWQGRKGAQIKFKLDFQQLCIFEPTTGERIV